MKKPDIKRHNINPGYIAGLVDATGLTKNECARQAGISERMLRYYTSLGDDWRPCPYAIQYLLESLK
jgi:hypothetical protein